MTIAVAQVLGGFGEAVLGAVRQPLTSDLAPPELVGRYFGLMTMVFQGCMGAANTIGGVVLQHSATPVWVIPLAASLLGVVGSLACANASRPASRSARSRPCRRSTGRSRSAPGVAVIVLAVARAAAQLPAVIGDLIATDAYLAARAAAADDGRRAITVARQRAADFGVRPETVGMIGFSAGAFLAVDVALDPRDTPMAFVGAIYGGETQGATVPADAPPLFTVVARDDLLSRIVEGVHADWSAADRSAELHTFARGSHGFGMVRQGSPSDVWPELFLSWLGDLGLR